MTDKNINFTPKTLNDLKEAVYLWCNNKKLAIETYGNINTWDVHNITDMSYLFSNCKFFNDNINNWDVSNVQNMERMFNYCINFNQPLNNWNVSNVKNLKAMFYGCDKFNQPLNNWSLKKVNFFL